MYNIVCELYNKQFRNYYFEYGELQVELPEIIHTN